MITESFSGAVLIETGQPLQLLDNIVPPNLGPGQVLVKMLYAGVCHSQLMEARGFRGEDKFLPHMLGHEAIGIVVAVGDGESKVHLDDRVVVGWIKGNGREGGPTQYKTTDGMVINSGSVTTFSEYAVVSENRLVLAPPNTPTKLSVLYGCAMPTGAGLVLNELVIRPENSVIVFGLGGIGLSALMMASTFAPQTLIAIDREDSKLTLAKSLGATHAINAQDPEFDRILTDLLPGGADYVIEAAGLTSTIEQGFDLTKRGGGELHFASHPKFGEKISIDPFELICGKSIRGTWGGGCKPDLDIPKMDELYCKGHLALEELELSEYDLVDINQALDDLENRKIVRALLRINPE